MAIASALSAPASIASARPIRANVPIACVTHRLDRSCIIFLCSDPASAGALGGLTLSTFNVPSGVENSRRDGMRPTGGEAIDQPTGKSRDVFSRKLTSRFPLQRSGSQAEFHAKLAQKPTPFLGGRNHAIVSRRIRLMRDLLRRHGARHCCSPRAARRRRRTRPSSSSSRTGCRRRIRCTRASRNGRKSVEKASGGTIKYKIYPAQQLGKAFDHYDMARDGIADMTYVNPGYQPGRFPIIGAGELPFLMANAKGGIAAIDAWYRKYAARRDEGREVLPRLRARSRHRSTPAPRRSWCPATSRA